ncbi:MAG: VacB/RNase II family 3'-5' exoribonuclease, partial [Bacilli bacterium]|nr:VacB/RNase II family 3'-5' exoribonuclease [Bacilli bacterium]
MEHRIIEILKNKKKALSLEEIDNLLGLGSVEQYKELSETINKLEKDFIIYRSNKNKFLLLEDSPLKKGILSVNKKGFGFVDLNSTEEDIYIHPNNFHGAIHGDTVLVELISKKGIDKEEGRILKVLKRELKKLVGELYYQRGNPYLSLDDNRIKLNIKIDNKDLQGAVSGHKVVVEIDKHLGNNDYSGKIIKVLGHKKDPGVDVLSIVHKYNINDTFSEEVMAEVEQINDRVLESELIGRRDLRNEKIFTIDSIDTKDIDDAISLKRSENGNYVLGVHIADVSYYVKENTEIDNEAYVRGTSVYLADRVIPMLPHKLSNEICSLNENEDRLTITCEMEIDSQGEIASYDIFESVIQSKKKMTYDLVNKILETNEISEGYEDYAETLKAMQNLSLILRKNKIKRGYIDFDTDEAQIIIDDKGKAIDVKLRDRGPGQEMIEDFMIAANESV